MHLSNINTDYALLPDIINIICEEYYLKRSTVSDILLQSGRQIDFLNNPQSFLEKFLKIIKNNLSTMIINGIKYIKANGKEYFIQEIFNMSELKANLEKDAVAVKHNIYDYVVYDSSTVEKPFALALDDDPEVKLFFKLPNRFKVDTPIESYNPDWAVYMDKEDEEKLYFIIETKGNTNLMQLRPEERLKIKYGKEHFKALENDMELLVVKDWKLLKKEL